MAKTFVLQKFDNGMHYIILDAKTVTALTKHNNKRVICTLNNAVAFHCAIMPKKEGGHFINIGAGICKKLRIKEGATVQATFTVDDTPFQFEMPAELEEVLNTDTAAHKAFLALTEGNQRGLMYLVSQVKSGDKRIERALKIAEKLKHGITSPRSILK